MLYSTYLFFQNFFSTVGVVNLLRRVHSKTAIFLLKTFAAQPRLWRKTFFLKRMHCPSFAAGKKYSLFHSPPLTYRAVRVATFSFHYYHIRDHCRLVVVVAIYLKLFPKKRIKFPQFRARNVPETRIHDCICLIKVLKK